MKDHDVDDSLIMLKVASGCLDGRMPCLLKGSSLPCSKECGIQEHKLPTRCSTTVKAGTSWEGVPGIRWDKNSIWFCIFLSFLFCGVIFLSDDSEIRIVDTGFREPRFDLPTELSPCGPHGQQSHR